jgi:hypothetical protein
MNAQLALMKARIEHNRKKQEEDYQKEINLRLAAKGIKPSASGK